MSTHVREAAAVLRGLHATCAHPERLPSTNVLRHAALHVRSELPDLLATRDVGRLKSFGLVDAHISALLKAFPSKDDIARLDAGIRLLRHGVASRLVMPAWTAWGPAAPDKVREDPYGACWDLKAELTDAEAIADRLGLSKERRVVGHVTWEIRRRKRDGHTAHPIREPVHAPSLRIVDGFVGLVEDVDAEAWLAERVRERVRERFLDLPEANESLSPDQNEAIKTLVSAAISVVTGGPGTGKSTLVRALSAQFKCLLTAPTGRAARNMGGSTVHSASGGRLLRRPIQETSVEDVPEDTELVMVDEASMLTVELMIGVMNLCPPKAHVVLVGDADQLPPVGTGNVFKDLLGKVPTATLTHNFRSCTDVQRFAAGLLRGEVVEVPAVTLVRASTESERMVGTLRLACDNDVEVLVPWNSTRHLLNRALQSTKREVPVTIRDHRDWGFPTATGSMTTDAQGMTTVTARGKSVRFAVNDALTVTRPLQNMMEGDAVMCLKNQNKKRVQPGHVSACNGDVGVLVRAGPKMIVRFEDGISEFPSEEWLTLAYAGTVHKHQGSECDAVVLPVARDGWDRHMLYTAVTRARSRVWIVGTREDLHAAVARVRSDRCSFLGKFLG